MENNEPSRYFPTSYYIPDESWGPGPWQEEKEDNILFTYKGYTCLAKRNAMYTWNGYIALPPEHPWCSKDYTVIDAEVHGGLTFSDRIVLALKSGNLPEMWWIGFDTGHARDLSPVMSTWVFLPDDFVPTYKTLAYVKEQIEMLADQAEEQWKETQVEVQNNKVTPRRYR